MFREAKFIEFTLKSLSIALSTLSLSYRAFNKELVYTLVYFIAVLSLSRVRREEDTFNTRAVLIY